MTASAAHWPRHPAIWITQQMLPFLSTQVFLDLPIGFPSLTSCLFDVRGCWTSVPFLGLSLLHCYDILFSWFSAVFLDILSSQVFLPGHPGNTDGVERPTLSSCSFQSTSSPCITVHTPIFTLLCL